MNLIQKISPYLFRIARSPISGLFIRFSFAYLSRLLPVNRLEESARSIAFYHPVPGYDFHGLVVPKLIKPAFLAFDYDKEKDRAALIDILKLGQQVGREQQLSYFSMIVNGGIYQDVPQVHFHIAKNENDEEEPDYELTEEDKLLSSKVAIFLPSNSRWEYHRVLQHENLSQAFMAINLDDAATQNKVIDLFLISQAILNEEKLTGFSVMISVRERADQRMQLQIVSNHINH